MILSYYWTQDSPYLVICKAENMAYSVSLSSVQISHSAASQLSANMHEAEMLWWWRRRQWWFTRGFQMPDGKCLWIDKSMAVPLLSKQLSSGTAASSATAYCCCCTAQLAPKLSLWLSLSSQHRKGSARRPSSSVPLLASLTQCFSNKWHKMDFMV